MKKPRVLFPFTEAGMGHIMPLRSIADAFEKKYGDKAEIVRSEFFTETNEKPLIDFEKQMCEFVKDQNKHVSFGFFTTIIMYFFGTGICCHNVMRNYVPGAFKAATRHMDELNADLVDSTHWATNYYAVKCSSKPLTALYCPDAHLNPLFEYKSDLTMLSMLPGYKKAAKKKRRFNKKNLKLVPFCIRPQAFEIPLDKQINREKMGLPKDKFTIVLAEGGYGIGKMQAICEEIIAQDLPVTLIPVCGKNEELYEHFKTLKVGENTTFLPQGFCTTILEYIASADLFLGKSGNIIAVYYAVGEIDDSKATNEGIHAQRVIRDLRKLREDDSVKAVVLRVNSPGGSAYGSEQIWREVVLLKEVKPVIVSMGDYAASGGYYISCAANCIVADPTTLTGSIGIFGMFPNAQGLLTDKLGLHFDVVKTNPFADMGDLSRPFNAEEREALQTHINNGYKLFVKRCADGRGMTTEAIEKIAEGRVWTGAAAKELGLVDELGGLDKALEIAAESADITNYSVINYPKKGDVFSAFLTEEKNDYLENRMSESLGEYYRYVKFLHHLKGTDRIQARMPFELCIK